MKSLIVPSTDLLCSLRVRRPDGHLGLLPGDGRDRHFERHEGHPERRQEANLEGMLSRSREQEWQARLLTDSQDELLRSREQQRAVPVAEDRGRGLGFREQLDAKALGELLGGADDQHARRSGTHELDDAVAYFVLTLEVWQQLSRKRCRRPWVVHENQL